MKSAACIPCLCGLLLSAAAAALPADLTLETLLDIRHPSRPAWSGDGSRVAFVWERAGVENLYVVSAGGGTPQALTHRTSGLLGGPFWAPDGLSVYFEDDGDLWRAPVAGGEPARLWSTTPAEGDFALSHDGRRLVFARDGDLYVRDLGSEREVRLTESPEVEAGPAWSPDDALLAFSVVTSKRRETVPAFVGGKIAFLSQGETEVGVGVVAAQGGPVKRLRRGDGWHVAPRWLDRSHLTLQRQSSDFREREVVLADAGTGEMRVLHRDHDAKFWSLEFLGAEPLPSPDGRRVAFVGDQDGFDHVYVVAASGGPAVQVTKGEFDVAGLAWAPDSRRLAFDANTGANPGARELHVVDLGRLPQLPAPRVRVAGGRGTHTGAVWDPAGRRLLVQRTDPRSSADLFVAEARADGPTLRLTDSFPSALDRDGLVAPEFVRYPSPDGRGVPAWLFVPKGLDRGRKHPAIVWVHGDGITQNFDGWHTRRDYAVYYSVHQYLVQRGYVVLAVDYRGSIGYGRDWRQGHYRDLGGKDYEDIAAGLPYLGRLGFVDTDRVGIWGLSYGGFMALQAVTVTPDLFRCAIDVAGVQDWRYWYADPGGPWIRGRMGAPEEDPDLYDRASPIHRVDRMTRPLLVLHGTADVNVPFLESVRLVDAAQKAGKEVEFVMYPGEFHYFQRAHVLKDAWRRVESFFDLHLKPSP